MSGGWRGSDRGSRLPADWPTRVAAVKMRAGGVCEAIGSRTGRRCPNPGTDCDHVVLGDDHALANLQWLCRWHHGRKSSAEGNAAKRTGTRRGPERHPGLR